MRSLPRKGRTTMKKTIKLTWIAVLMTVLLCACSSQPASTVTQSDLGPEPENITEETILGRWYFKGIETEYIDFYDDGTYETNNDGKEGGGTYTLSEDCKTIHLKEGDVDDDITVMYGQDCMNFVWQNHKSEQFFTRQTESEVKK